MNEILQPKGWPRPRGYSNGVKARDGTIFVAGQVGWDERGEMVGDDFVAQAAQALRNVVAVLEAGGASASDIVRMTWYVTDLDEYRGSERDLGRAYQEIVGPHYCAMTLVKVAGLLEDGAKVEVEATAVAPSKG